MNKQKLIGTIVGIVLFIAAIAGLTYAALSWTSGDMNKVVSSKCFNVLYDKGTDFSGNITPSTDYTGGISVTVKMDIDSACNINAKGKIYLTTDTTTSENLYTEGLLNYQVLINGSVTDLKGSITSSGDTVIDVGFLNKNTVATTTYTVYVWINGEYVTNEHATSTFSGSVRSEAVQTTEQPPSVNLLNHITTLYRNGNPTLITQETSGDSYYYSYQDDANTWGLMNDGLKIDNTLDATTIGLATTVTDTAALTSGTEGNIRYFGPSASVNNYIYFNCSDYSNQSDATCEKWRIIGIVDGKLKLIRNGSIGDYSWDDDGFTNDWNTSKLKDILNSGTYYSELQIKNGKTLELISDGTWYVNGISDFGIDAKSSYVGERMGNNTWPGKIALAYPSDYAYGADLNSCTNTLYNYAEEICTKVNWLTGIFTTDNYYWLITPNFDNSIGAWSISIGNLLHTPVFEMGGVVPVLYLDPTLSFNGVGDGSSGNPYQLLVS